MSFLRMTPEQQKIMDDFNPNLNNIQMPTTLGGSPTNSPQGQVFSTATGGYMGGNSNQASYQGFIDKGLTDDQIKQNFPKFWEAQHGTPTGTGLGSGLSDIFTAGQDLIGQFTSGLAPDPTGTAGPTQPTAPTNTPFNPSLTHTPGTFTSGLDPYTPPPITPFGEAPPEPGKFNFDKFTPQDFQLGEFEFDESKVNQSKVSPLDYNEAFNQIKQAEALSGTPLSSQQIEGFLKPQLQAKAKEAVEIERINAEKEWREKGLQLQEHMWRESGAQTQHNVNQGFAYSTHAQEQGFAKDDFNWARGIERDNWVFRRDMDKESQYFMRDVGYEQYRWGQVLEKENWQNAERFKEADYFWRQAVDQKNTEMANAYQMEMYRINVDIYENTLDRELKELIAGQMIEADISTSSGQVRYDYMAESMYGKPFNELTNNQRQEVFEKLAGDYGQTSGGGDDSGGIQFGLDMGTFLENL